MSDGMEWIVRFELPNGGQGPETVSSDEIAREFDHVVVLLLRDHHCQVSRERAQAYSESFERFRERDAAVVAALPDDQEKAAFWRDRYDLSYPVLADTATEIDANAQGATPAMTDGTPRFDAFVEVETGVDSLPGIGILDATGGMPRLVHTEGGDALQDCPGPDAALDALEDVQAR